MTLTILLVTFIFLRSLGIKLTDIMNSRVLSKFIIDLILKILVIFISFFIFC